MDSSRRNVLRSALGVGALSGATALYAPESAAAASGSGSGVDWINVTDPAYGASGDGSTDDTAAIQAAIDAVGADGGTVYLPAAAGYLLNGSALTITTHRTVLRGDGAVASQLVIGADFSGIAAVVVEAYDCQVRDLSVNGQSATTTSNPACNGIEISGVRRCKVLDVDFLNVNGWAVEVASASSGAQANPLGTQITRVRMDGCAGGVHFLGNAAQLCAMNAQLTDMQFYGGGVISGTNANLDAIRVEDAWDVLVANAIAWMGAGTGSSLHVLGNSAATFVSNLDALGSKAGPCVLIETGAAKPTSPQNVQIRGGVIQQGTVGMQIADSVYQVHVSGVRFINNQTHGLAVTGDGYAVHIDDCAFSLSGQGLTATSYDIAWSGTTQGTVGNCWFGSQIVADSTVSKGVVASIDIATAGQAVLVERAAFQGAGASSANWFAGGVLPAGALEAGSGAVDFLTTVTFSNGSRPAALEPATDADTALAVNVGGAQDFDAWRLSGDGSQHWGPGTATRDTVLARAAAGGLQLTQPSGLVQAVGGVLHAQTSTTTVANTTAATALTGFSVPAGDPSAGSVYRLRGYGVYSTTGTPTLAFTLAWGGTSIAAVPAATLPSSISGAPFSYEAEIVLRSATSATGMLRVMIDTSKSTDAAASYLGVSATAVTVSTSSAATLAVTAAWGTASASNTISLVGGSVERIA